MIGRIPVGERARRAHCRTATRLTWSLALRPPGTRSLLGSADHRRVYFRNDHVPYATEHPG
jgi:hypothetical protein